MLTTFSTNSTEAALVNAIAGLQQAGVNDLVLDLRYITAAGWWRSRLQLAYMIAGPHGPQARRFARQVQRQAAVRNFGTARRGCDRAVLYGNARDVRSPLGKRYRR